MTVAELISSNCQAIERYRIYSDSDIPFVSDFYDYTIEKYGNEKVDSWSFTEIDLTVLEINLE